MNERQQQAYDLHLQGLGPTEIGKSLGITRQSAYGLVKRAEATAKAFTNINEPLKPSKDGELLATPTTPFMGAEPIGIWGERLANENAHYTGWTLSTYNAVYNEVRTGQDPLRFWALAEELLERDSNVRTLVDIRSSQVATLPIENALPENTTQRDRKRTDEGIEMLLKAGLREALTETAKVPHFGAMFVEPEWAYTPSGRLDVVGFHIRPQRFFVADRENPRKYYIRPAKPGGELVPAPAGRIVPVFSNGKPGNPVRSALALPAAHSYVQRSIIDRDWLRFLNKYGMPSAKVKFPEDVPTPDKKEMAAAKALARDLGSGGVAVLKGGMDADFMKDSAVAGSSEAFERKVRYEDERQAKLYLGGSLTTGTSNTGSGGSQALGNVHAELRFDLLKIDVLAQEAWINEVLHWWCVWNFGESAMKPRIKLVVEEPEDLKQFWENVLAAQKAGAKVSKKGVEKRGGVPLAADDDPDDVLEPVAAPAPQAEDPTDDEDTPPQRTSANSAACPVHGATSFAKTGAVRDGIDDLVDESLSDGDWETVSLAIDEAIQEVAAQSTGFDDLRQKLAAFVESGDVQDLRLFLTQQKAKARLAAAEGLDLTAPSAGSGAKD